MPNHDYPVPQAYNKMQKNKDLILKKPPQQLSSFGSSTRKKNMNSQSPRKAVDKRLSFF